MRKVLSCILVAAVSLTAAFGGPKDPPENALLDAVALYVDGNPGASLPVLDSLATLDPKDDAVQYYLGLVRFACRDANGAISALKNAVALDTTNVWYKETLANAYLALGVTDEAGLIYLDLSAKDPRKFRNSYTLTLMADAYRMKRDYKSFFSTLKEFAQDESLTPESKSKYLTAALGGFDTQTFKSILPQVDTLTQVFVAANPDAVEPHELHAEIAGYREDYATVIDESYKIMKLSGRDSSTVVTRLGLIGDCYHQMGNTSEAYKVYDQVLRINPRYCPVLNNYAWYLCTSGRKLSKAARMSKITVEEEPDNPTYLDTYGWILYLQHKYKEAKPYFKHAMIYGGKDSATVLEHYSKVLEVLGEKDLAEYYKGLADSKK